MKKSFGVLISITLLMFVATVNAQTSKRSKSGNSSYSKSAKSGQFVSKSYTRSHPATTYTSKKRRK